MLLSLCSRAARALGGSKAGRRPLRRMARKNRTTLALEVLETRTLPSYVLNVAGITPPDNTGSGFSGDLPVVAFQFTPTTSSTSQAGTTQVKLGSLQVTMPVGQGSAPLLQDLASLKETIATLTELHPAVGPSVPPKAVAAWQLGDVCVTSVAATDSAETITLTYGSIRESLATPAVSTTWDSVTGAGSGPADFGKQTVKPGGTILDFGTGQVVVQSAGTTLSNSAIGITQFMAAPVASGFTFTTAFGTTSPALLAALTTGRAVRQVTLTNYALNNITHAQQVFEQLTLSNATVVSDAISGTSADNGPTEIFTLKYGAVRETITPTSSNATPMTTSYDFSTGSAVRAANFGMQKVSALGTVIDFGSGKASVMTYATGLTNAVSVNANGQLVPALAQADSLTFTTQASLASPGILAAMASRAPALSHVIITTYKPGVNGPATSVHLDLGQVFITADSISFSAGQRVPQETLTLHYGTVQEQVTAPASKTGSSTLTTTASWDFGRDSGTGPATFGKQTVTAGLPTLSVGDTQIAVTSYAGGVVVSGDGGATSAVAGLHAFQFTAPLGLDGPGLLEALTMGRSLPGNVVLTIPAGARALDQRITLTGAFVAADTISLGAGGMPQESFTLAYTKLEEDSYNITTVQTQGLLASTTVVTEPRQAGLSTAPLANLMNPISVPETDPAYRLFLNISGINGSTIQTGFPDDFDVAAFSNPVTASTQGSTAGDFTVVLPTSPQSAALLQAVATAESFPTITLIAAAHETLGLTPAITWALDNATITSDGIAGGTGAAQEVLTIHCDSITETMTSLDRLGKPLPPITTSWDLLAHQVSGPKTFGGQRETQAPITLDFGTGQTAVYSFSTGATEAVTLDKFGIGHATGQPQVDAVTVTVPVNITAPSILAAVARGGEARFPGMMLTVFNAKKQVKETLFLGDVTITSAQLSMASGANGVMTLVLKPMQIKQTDYVYNSTGALTKTETAVVGD
jgi:type VI protein secretion system component Hcp